jgi:hypothetical protein
MRMDVDMDTDMDTEMCRHTSTCAKKELRSWEGMCCYIQILEIL